MKTVGIQRNILNNGDVFKVYNSNTHAKIQEFWEDFES